MVGGAGHVGVPLVLSFAAQGLTVNVNDINEQALATLKSGHLPFHRKRRPTPARPRRCPTSGYSSRAGRARYRRGDPVIVTIGTPVDEFLNPVRNVIQDCIDPLLPHLHDGQLLVLRSTLYPGTTDWIDGHLKRRAANSRWRSVRSASRRVTASRS